MLMIEGINYFWFTISELQRIDRNFLDPCIFYQLLPDKCCITLEFVEIVAFILEAFFAELECEEDDKDGRSKERRRYVVGAKTRSQRVDRLLHHMLSAELNDSGDT
ncbi:hypothetical protein Pint_02249 [Pistacia integerrima]|uniref:Uncharacterized protein n=1 Tax=Pistacia integerrima TaxID=434235 RepID=A0ACC0ZJD5_9ROSI|nr:hypothetical protein Pint_02249 [Pistacia integerrima]